MNDHIRKAMSQRIDDQITLALTGTTTNAAPDEPFTLDKLQKIMLDLPAKETWLSSRLFPSDRAWIVRGAGENFTCSHPTFWFKVEYEMRRQEEVSPRAPSQVPNLFGAGLKPIEIDPCEEDSPDAAAWRRDHWRHLAEAMRVAMVPLPDWLRGAPEFGEFG